MLNAQIVVVSDCHSSEELAERLGAPTGGHATGDRRRGGVHEDTRWELDVSVGHGTVEERLEHHLRQLDPSVLSALRLKGDLVRVEMWAKLDSSYDWPGLSFSTELLKVMVECGSDFDLDILVYPRD